MTGLPWRLYLSLRKLSLSYLSKEQANTLYEKSIDKIQRRARGNPTTLRNGQVGAAAQCPYKHPLLKRTFELNNSLRNATNAEFAWVMQALQHSVSVEAYDIGIGLARLLIDNDNQLSSAERATVFQHIAATLIACGQGDEARRLAVRWAGSLPSNDVIASLKISLLPDAVTGDRSAMILPSGKLNALRMSTAIQTGRMSPEQALDFYFDRQSLFDSNPQNYLCLFNAWRKVDLTLATTFFNKFTGHYRIPPVVIDAIGDNVLQGVSFVGDRRLLDGPLVSIVMGSFGGAATLAYSVGSLLQQTYRNIEVLVVDDQSDDDSVRQLKAIAADDSRLRLFKSVNNQGVYNIRNALIERAEGQFITFHDSDDLSIPSRIETQFHALITSGRPLCYGRWIRITPDGRAVFFRDQAALRMCVVSLFAHRDVFRWIGPYRRSQFGADTEFLERAKEAIGPDGIEAIKTPLNFGLWSDSSLTRKPGIEALEDGFRSPARRQYAQSAFLQRLLGHDIIDDREINSQLNQHGMLREPSELQALTPASLLRST